MKTTLLLTSSYEPMHVISWREAVKLFFLEKAEILETYEDNLRGPSVSMKIPSVMRLVRNFKKKKVIDTVKFSRTRVYTRDKYTCQYCCKTGSFKEFTFDHVLPKSRGGKTSWDNIVTSCKSCNTKKRDRTPEEAGMQLLRQPKRPKWLPSVAINISHGSSSAPPVWKQYLWS
jgi:5-methylcytosine-specific restriction endonuclease McrA